MRTARAAGITRRASSRSARLASSPRVSVASHRPYTAPLRGSRLRPGQVAARTGRAQIWREPRARAVSAVRGRLETLVTLRLACDARPVVAHRTEPDRRPVGRLIGVVATPGMAGRPQR